MSKTALITGINGQDGSYLAELLLNKGYKVVGLLKRNSVCETQTIRIQHIFNKLNLEYADMTDLSSLIRVIQKYMPDEIYNLASQSHVRISFDQPLYTAQATGIGVLNLLEAVKLIKPDTKVYQASSSEMFGNNVEDDGYQRETTSLNPVSPYGCAKVFGYNICRNYRKSYNMFISNGILYNHESPRRSENFVTNKVCKEAVRIKKGLSTELKLGNLEACRDWSHAKDMVIAMWLILQQDKPDDFVCASGISRSVRDLCIVVFEYLDLDYKKYVTLDEKYLRPEELHILRGDATKAKNILGWEPTISFNEMIYEMIEYWKKFIIL